MEDQFDVSIIKLRRMLYNENKHLKQLKASEGNLEGYIQFKKGKIYGIQLAIENLIKLKGGYYENRPVSY